MVVTGYNWDNSKVITNIYKGVSPCFSKMKTKMIRIYWRDWRKLRKAFKVELGETCADYLARIMETWEDWNGRE